MIDIGYRGEPITCIVQEEGGSTVERLGTEHCYVAEWDNDGQLHLHLGNETLVLTFDDLAELHCVVASFMHERLCVRGQGESVEAG